MITYYELGGHLYLKEIVFAGSHMFINARTIDDYLVAYALPRKYLEGAR